MNRDIITEVREIIAMARPANQNQPQPLRLLPQRDVDELVRRLEAVGVRGVIGRPQVEPIEFDQDVFPGFAEAATPSVSVPPRLARKRARV